MVAEQHIHVLGPKKVSNGMGLCQKRPNLRQTAALRDA